MTIPGTDADLDRALADVNLPTLLMVMTQLVGDNRYLTERFRPKPIETPEGSMFPDDSGRFTPEVAAEIRAVARALLQDFRARSGELPPAPSAARLKEMMTFSTAEPVSDTFCEMLLEETNFVNRDRQWQGRIEQVLARKAPDGFSVIVVGAGMSGLCSGIKLKAAGIPFVILEKNPEVGGTWYENSYPDCGVDTPNHFYSFSFDRNPDWSGYFSKRDELFAYFDRCADKYGLRDSVQFNTEVTAMRYDAQACRWHVDVRRVDGRTETLTANAVISAVGQLNRPSTPDFPGLASFSGAAFHSARWRHDVDVTGKRVAVIGTGCSAVQLLPKTAAKAAQVHVFQRSPHWLSPNRDYYRPVEAGLKWALKHIPCYAEWHRARMIFSFADRNWGAVPADPSWAHPERSTNEANEGMRNALIAYMSEQLGDRQDLLPKVVPDFPVFGKRLIVDNNWYPTLARENVELVTDEIRCIHPNAIETADGVLREVDVIIFATGFNTNHFLWPMDVVGRSGQTLENLWGDYPRAYKGILVPDYPNLFCLYGPNTNIVHGGSIIYTIECQVHYMMQCLALMLERQARELEVSATANEAYNEEVQAISRTLAWGHPGVQSWYKNSDGKVVNNSPFPNLEYWRRTHDAEPDLYALR